MTESSKDAGIISVLLQRLETQRLPRALALREKVDQGKKLNEFDIEFLEEAIADAHEVKPLIERHPEYQELAARVIHLYKEITDKAMENENNS
jgi:hypothetical protein